MENFVVSARKYRPQSFEDVVGQEAITSTLMSAIENNHLAQAFLFCGPRGVGKTTCARILAKTINRRSTENSEDEDFSFNIFELDAASNNKVEHIRELIDQVRVPPQVGNYKVYIIDEVHMLSQQAFNAFLKTLEEPPPYAIFILATTEKHKIIPTILSRCQIFDFHRITVKDMAAHLQKIAEKEGINAEPDALHLIAEKADGALRDALSIFDQIVSFSGKDLSYTKVIENLNILDYDYYFKVGDAIRNGDTAQVLILFDEILNKGFDGHHFINGLAGHFRNLLVCQNPATLNLLEVGENIKARYEEQAGQLPAEQLLKGLELLSDIDVQFKSSKNPRLLVELALLRLCNLNGAEKKTKDELGPESSLPEPKPMKAGDTQEKPAKEPQAEAQNSAPQTGLETDGEKEQLKPQAEEQPETPAGKNEPEEPQKDLAQTGKETESPEKQPETGTEKHDPVPQNQELAGNPEDRSKTRKISRKLGRRKKSEQDYSISGIRDKSKEQGNAGEPEVNLDPVEGKPRDAFGEPQLKDSINKFTQELRNEGKTVLVGCLQASKINLLQDYAVEIVVHNNVQSQQLDEIRPVLLNHLRSSLNNWGITLNCRVDESERANESLLPHDQLRKMEEKNPVLARLRQQFDLDVDF